jgi:ABC-type multidrug transport system fused ATPase/permease subunit
MVVAGLCEGLGLALFVPVLEILDGGGTVSGKGLAAVTKAFDAVQLPANLFTFLTLIVVLVAGSLIIVFIKDRMLIRAKFGYTGSLRRSLSESLFHARWDHLSKQASGEVTNQLLIECIRSAGGLTHQVMVVATAVQIAIFAAISAILSWQLLVLCFLLAGLVAGLIWPLQRRSWTIGEKTNRINKVYGFHIADFLKGRRLIRATGSEDRVLDRMQSLNLTNIDVLREADVIRAFAYFLVQALTVVILAGIIAISRQGLGVSTPVLLTFLLIMARMAPRFVQLQQYYQAYAIYMAAFPVIAGAIAEGRAEAEDRRAGGRPFSAITEGVALEDVSFRHSNENKGTVEAVSLSIPRNSMTAVVGVSGAGKSTLMDLIAGLREPCSGRITVDGDDLADIDLVSWRQRIGYVTQDVIVFNDTVRNNLLFAHPNAGSEELRRVLELVHMYDIISALPDGLDTVLGEGGIRLSGGQKQRLALARALIGDPQLLLLDEATSALDNESERLIQKALESITHELTIVVVAHRLATVRKADTIFVMEGGRIVESGSFDELVAGKGRFSELHESQFS